MRILELILVLMGFTLSAAPASGLPLEKNRNLRVMPLGDSITLGKNGGYGGYRRVLYEWLIAGGYSMTYVGKQNFSIHQGFPNCASDGAVLFHEGYGSFRTDMILEGGTAEKQVAPPLAATLATFQPDVVLLMIGTNDIIQDWKLEGLEERVEKILETIYGVNEKTVVLVGSIAPLKNAKLADKEPRVLAYNAALLALVEKEKARGRTAVFVDVHATLEKRGLSGDGVHPSDPGYAQMAAAWYQALTGIQAPSVDAKNPLLLPQIPGSNSNPQNLQ